MNENQGERNIHEEEIRKWSFQKGSDGDEQHGVECKQARDGDERHGVECKQARDVVPKTSRRAAKNNEETNLNNGTFT
ncbi:hypothetical protein SDJN03_06473, partial [Cucurbita argyrosperma subsp. sororia]